MSDELQPPGRVLAQLPHLTWHELDVLGALVDLAIAQHEPSAFTLLNSLRTAVREAQSSIMPRRPYIGDGRDGALRSAQIDEEEADTLEHHDPRRLELLASARQWRHQAER